MSIQMMQLISESQKVNFLIFNFNTWQYSQKFQKLTEKNEIKGSSPNRLEIFAKGKTFQSQKMKTIDEFINKIIY